MECHKSYLCSQKLYEDDQKLPVFFMNRSYDGDNIIFGNSHQLSRKKNDKLKTVGVGIVLCLNVGVEPPQNEGMVGSAKQQCWIDPRIYHSATKAVENIGKALRQQYQKFQPRARFRYGLDPTTEELSKLCHSLRRNSKDDRILIHYNGHGVPYPTPNGEIWVFDEKFSRYVPVSMFDILAWVSGSTIFVFDCPRAGLTIKYVEKFLLQQKEEEENKKGPKINIEIPSCTFDNCIQLGACGANENIPLVPGLPGDIFTSCLTTPVKIALYWYVSNNMNILLPEVTIEMIQRIPGDEKDRHTLLGELNWIFVAITDSIAWMTFRHDLATFKKYFREDLLLSNIMRNYLLAERIMHSFNCRTVTSPELPKTYNHPMWLVWDLVLDQCLFKLPEVIQDVSKYVRCTFFQDQLTALRIWLMRYHSDEKPPDQLAILLQVLLNHDYRETALELLNEFLKLGPWAVKVVLSVGFVPILIKLLQTTGKELVPLMVLIWAKIIGLDDTYQDDLLKEGVHKYFLDVLQDEELPDEVLAAAAFILARFLKHSFEGQKACLKNHLVPICLTRLHKPSSSLREWLALCLGLIWSSLDAARGSGIRDDAPEKLSELLMDPVPEVRATVVFALGKLFADIFEPNSESVLHHKIARMLTLVADGSPLVRKELVVAFYGFIMNSEEAFTDAIAAYGRKSRKHLPDGPILSNIASPCINLPSRSRQHLKMECSCSREEGAKSCEYLKSQTTFSSVKYLNIYHHVYESMIRLSKDVDPEVSDMASRIITTLNAKAFPNFSCRRISKKRRNEDVGSDVSGKTYRSSSLKPSLNERITGFFSSTSRKSRYSFISSTTSSSTFRSDEEIVIDTDIKNQFLKQFLDTNLVGWCAHRFISFLMRLKKIDMSVENQREWRYSRNARVRKDAAYLIRTNSSWSMEEETFVKKNHSTPSILKFHPFETHLVCADRQNVWVWDYESKTRLNTFFNKNVKRKQIRSMDIINEHDLSMLLIGSDDGNIRVWKNYINDNVEQVAGWNVLPHGLSSEESLDLVTDWEKKTGSLLTSGNVPIVSIWDANSEMKEQDLRTNSDSQVTSIKGNSTCQSILVAGFRDGSLKLFDRRLPSSDNCLMNLHGHSDQIVDVFLNERRERIISASNNGDVIFWDLRKAAYASKLKKTQPFLTRIAVHKHADIISCGSTTQGFKVIDYEGKVLNNIKHHFGIIGQKFGPICCLSFHPYWPFLAVASTDAVTSVFACGKSQLDLECLGYSHPF